MLCMGAENLRNCPAALDVLWLKASKRLTGQEAPIASDLLDKGGPKIFSQSLSPKLRRAKNHSIKKPEASV